MSICRVIKLFTLLICLCYITVPNVGNSASSLPPELDIILIVDRSNSMNTMDGGKTVWEWLIEGVWTLLDYGQTRGDSAGMNLFPVYGAVEQCNNNLHNPLQTSLEWLSVNPYPILLALQAEQPAGGTPTEPALAGSLAFATAHQMTNPDRAVIVILITDGFPSECDTDIETLAGLTAAAFDNFGVRTFVVSMGAAAAAASEFHMIAESGGTESAYPVVNNNEIGEILLEIRRRADPFDFRNGFETDIEVP